MWQQLYKIVTNINIQPHPPGGNVSKNEPIDWLPPPPPVGVVAVAKLRSARSISVLSKDGVSCVTVSPLAVFSGATG